MLRLCEGARVRMHIPYCMYVYVCGVQICFHAIASDKLKQVNFMKIQYIKIKTQVVNLNVRVKGKSETVA